MIIMSLLLFLFFAEPIEAVAFDRKFHRIEFYNNHIYCAPFTGRSIFRLTESRELKAVSFTDDVNYRIYDFHITPFAVYLNNGKSIEKFYFAQGMKENVFSSRDIASFIITSSDEVIFADREKDELVFLDFTNNVKFKEFDLQIKDLQMSDNVIYALTNNSIILFDIHGNSIEERKTPEKFSRIFVDNAAIFLFSQNKEYFYILNDDVQKIEFPDGISDICGNGKFTVILDGSGSHLYIYNRSDF